MQNENNVKACSILRAIINVYMQSISHIEASENKMEYRHLCGKR